MRIELQYGIKGEIVLRIEENVVMEIIQSARMKTKKCSYVGKPTMRWIKKSIKDNFVDNYLFDLKHLAMEIVKYEILK